MVCQCYQIGGPFIAEDPSCPVHGRGAREAGEDSISALRRFRERVEDVLSQELLAELDAAIQQAADSIRGY